MSTIPDLTQPAGWLPVVFMALMGIAVLAYVVLDGYDLGVGILLRRADDAEKDTMIASIGPFWDANETWLVLGVGLLLVAFPAAHGEILGALYLPVALMLFGLILRGVAFDFRVKARAHHKPWWNRAFYAGSVIATAAQGLMLGLYITGFQYDAANVIFAICTAGGLIAGYLLLGATWLIMKTEGALQLRAVLWARGSLWFYRVGRGRRVAGDAVGQHSRIRQMVCAAEHHPAGARAAGDNRAVPADRLGTAPPAAADCEGR